MSKSPPEPAFPSEPARRSFLMRASAVFFGGLVALFPFVAGFGVVLDPTRKRRSSASGATPTEAAPVGKSIRICPLEALTAGGAPQPFPVILDVVDDAWTRTFNQKVGMIFLQRAKGSDDVLALSAKCPHLGCMVDFNRDKNEFQCPCHESAFAEDGKKLYGPSLRGMDKLTTETRTIDGRKEVYVDFQKFQPGIEERKPL